MVWTKELKCLFKVSQTEIQRYQSHHQTGLSAGFVSCPLNYRLLILEINAESTAPNGKKPTLEYGIIFWEYKDEKSASDSFKQV